MNFEQFIDKCKELKTGDALVIVSEEKDSINPFIVKYPYTLEISDIKVDISYVRIIDFKKDYFVWLFDIENFHLIEFPNNKRKERINQIYE